LTQADGSTAAEIGRVVGAFGLHGEVKVATNDPADFRVGLALDACVPGGDVRHLIVASMRPHQNRLLVGFAGMTDADQADELRGARLTALIADLPPLPDSTFRDRDLVGMHVRDSRLGALGEVKEVLHYPHADMLVVGDRELLVPMLAAYGVTIDKASATISTSLPEGFEEL
jgi:16S rRNA processing protein RimM